jgi:hypothetical protein
MLSPAKASMCGLGACGVPRSFACNALRTAGTRAVLLDSRYPFWGPQYRGVAPPLLLTLALVSTASLYGDSISINGPLTNNGSIQIYDQYGDLYGEVWANINFIPAAEAYGGSTGVTGEAETYLAEINVLDRMHLGQPQPMPIPSGPSISFTVTLDIPASYAYINVDTYVLAGGDDCYQCQPELQITGLGGAASQSNAPNGPYNGIGTEYQDVPNPGELIISSEFNPFEYGASDTLNFTVIYTDAGNPTPEPRT